jgi:CRISPR-associated protein Cas2
MFTLVVYDISDDKNRTHLSKVLENFGLNRIQYSAFTGELNPHDRHVLLQDVKKYATGEKDSIYITPLCKRCMRACEIIAIEDISLIDDSKVKVV